MKVVSKTGLFVWLLLWVGGGCTQTEVEEDDIPPHALKEVDAGFRLNVLASRTPVTRSITFTENGTLETDTVAACAADTLQTRAATDLLDGQDSKIASLWVGQYDAAGNRLFSQYIESMSDNTVNIKLKQSLEEMKSHVWFVPNSGDLGEIATEKALKEHVLTYLSGETGLPSSNLCGMSGMWEGVVKEGGVKNISVDLTRLLAKITFTYAIGEGFSFTPSSVSLNSVPDKSQVTAPTVQLTEGITYKNYEGTASSSGATMYWYLPENMAGTVSAGNVVDSEKQKTGTGVTNATYIELTGTAVQGGVTYKGVRFRFYPGGDKNNYDIRRNSHYTMNVTLVGIDISDARITVSEIPPVTVDPGNMPAGKGGEKGVQITARPGEEWSFDMPLWLSALVDGRPVQAGATLTYQGPYKVTFLAAEANPKAEERNVTFAVKVNNENQSVTITQDGSTLEKGADISLGAAGNGTGSSSFTTTKGLAWDAAVSGEDWWNWADDNPWTSGNEATGESQILKVQTTAANPSAQARSGKITVKAGASVGDTGYTGLKQEIAVTQAGSTVSSSTKTVAAEGAENLTSSFTATPGLYWTADVVAGSWIRLVTTAGGPTIEAAGNITYHVPVNPSSALREDDIIVRAGDASSGPEGKIAVIQAGAILSVSGAQTVEATASATDHTSTFSATKGLSWNVSETMDWLTLTGTTDGIDNTTGANQEIKYSVVLNPNASNRSGNITVKAGNAVSGMDAGLNKTIKITQSGSTFTVSKTEIELENTETSGTVTVQGTDGLPWTVSPSEQTNGITPATTSSTATGADQTLTFNATANTGGAREATFTVAVTGGNRSKTVKVKQKAGLTVTIDQSVLTSYRTKTTDMGAYPPFNYDGSNRLPNGSSFNGSTTMTGFYTIQVQKGQKSDNANYSTTQSYCSSLNEDGTGWRIPTQIELYAMYINKAEIEDSAGASAFIGNNYWSSSVCSGNSGNRCLLFFGSGSFGMGSTGGSHYVRCVRTK